MKPSHSAIPEREPVAIDPRKAIPDAWKRAARERSGGVCAWLGCESKGPFEYDHALCLALGGKHANDNIQPLCIPHHKIKTARDVKMIARAKRCAGETGQRKRREARGGSSMKSRGFQETPEGYRHQWPKRSFPSRKPRERE